MKNLDQRVGVFIDVQNMYYSAQAIYHKKVNFGNIVKESVAGRKLTRAIAYAVKADIPEEEGFFDALHKLGLEVKTKDLQIFVDGKRKADWDVGIAIDAIEMESKLDTVILVSGDGDFAPLITHLQSRGCRVELVAFGKSTSAKVLAVADDFMDLDLEPDKYTLGGSRRFPRRRPAKTVV